MVMSVSELPAWGSVRAMVPSHCPAIIFGRYRSFISLGQNDAISKAAPVVSPW